MARVASGLLSPSEGRVEVSGTDFSRKPAQDFATAGIAHAPEGRSVFATLNVEENLVLPFRRQFGRASVRPALDRAYDLFPALSQRRRQNAGSLSGGEQRMLTLARVLVLEPKLLIADELSLGLAPIITAEIYRVLERILEAGTALLIVEQHIDHALALANQVVVLERGKVVLAGHPSPRGHLGVRVRTAGAGIGLRSKREAPMSQTAETDPTQMPVAVYRGRGDIGVEQRAVPTPGSGQVSGGGESLRDLRVGPPPDGGGLGQARLGGRP